MDEENICGIPEDDIQRYALMSHYLNRKSYEQAGEMARFLNRYGKDIKEIEGKIKVHLEECSRCNRFYSIQLEEHSIAEAFAFNEASIMGADFELREKRRSMKIKWGIEHASYENPEDLRQYLYEKVLAVTKGRHFKSSLEFDRHIESCDSCRYRYDLGLESELELELERLLGENDR